MVMSHAIATFPATPQRTAEALRAAPAPITQPVIVCVVDTGMPSQELENSMIEPPSSAHIGLRREHAELIASHARDGVLVAYGARDGTRHVAQEIVAGGVTEAVVELLEAVEVEHQHAELMAGALVAGDLVLDSREEASPVGHAREGIAER